MRLQRLLTHRDLLIDSALWTAAGVSAATTLVFSLFKGPPGASVLPDYVLHASAYAVTTLCLLLAAVWRPGRDEGMSRFGALPLAAALLAAGIMIEFIQGAFAARDAQVSDAVADAVGIAVALGVHGLLRAAPRRSART